MYEPDEIVEGILRNNEKVGIEEWLKVSQTYFDFSRFRRMFNIFVEEQMEKDLVYNFNEWNNLYVEEDERYVSYVISYKWFESWKIYVQEEYGITINAAVAKVPTLKSFKTKKTTKLGGEKTNKKIANINNLRELKIEYEPREQEDDVPEAIKNFDFVHSNIGSRPREIYNNVLEG